MKYKNDQTSKHCIVSRREGTFQREAGKGNNWKRTTQDRSADSASKQLLAECPPSPNSFGVLL